MPRKKSFSEGELKIIRELKPEIKEIKEEKAPELESEPELEREEAGESEEGREEREQEGEETFIQDRTGGFSRVEPSSRAPVLQAETSEEPVENLEQFAGTIPSAAGKAEEKAGERITYVKNLPDYAGTTYSSQAIYSAAAEEGMELRGDAERDVARGMTMHRQPTIEEIREINLGAWQREQLGSRGITMAEESEREYQLAVRKEKKQKSQIPPFEE